MTYEGRRERAAGVGRRRPEGEGGRRRERASGPMGNREESCERGGGDLVWAGEIF